MIQKLYKLDSKGKVRVWWAETLPNTNGEFEVCHGIDGGQIIVERGTAYAKNVGRSNATTPNQQAAIEVAALYAKKQDRDGYKTDLSEPDKFIAPMLARDFSKLPHQVPENILLYLSAKLDGVRCIWDHIRKKLISRKGTVYHMPHIEAHLQDFPFSIDGELYCHGYQLNRITAATKKPNDLTPRLQFHVFDAISESPYDLRIAATFGLIKALNTPFIVCVESVIRYKHEIKDTHDFYTQQGFEGVMIRIPSHPYHIGVRSPALFKYKEFFDGEFKIIDVLPDKDGGAVLQCVNRGAQFNVRCRGTDEYRQQQIADRDQLIGKWVTVRYQAITEFDVPQFPVGIAIRDYE